MLVEVNQWRAYKTYFLAMIMVFCSTFFVKVQSRNDLLIKKQEKLKDIIDEFFNKNSEILGAIVQLDVPGQKSFKAAKGFFDLSKKVSISISIHKY